MWCWTTLHFQCGVALRRVIVTEFNYDLYIYRVFPFNVNALFPRAIPSKFGSKIEFKLYFMPSLPLSTFSFSVCFFAFYYSLSTNGSVDLLRLLFVICIWSRPSSLCWFWYYLNHEMGAAVHLNCCCHPVPYPILSVFCRWLSVPKYSYPNWRRWNDNWWYPLYILFFFLFVLHYFPYYIAYIICGEGFSPHFSCGRRAVSASCPNS